MQSPKAYRWALDHPGTSDTPSKALGRAVHAAILEPDIYARDYIVRPADIDGRTAIGKGWIAAHAGKVILSASDGAVVDECCRSVADETGVILTGGRAEVELEWSIDGVDAAGRLDYLAPTVLVDLKTCRDISKIERDAWRYGYHGQLAWYLDGAVAAGAVAADADTLMICVETAPPYDCVVYRAVDETIACGRALYRDLLTQLKGCMVSDWWPGRASGVVDWYPIS
jgi:exodeoxyribonuclease VIII